MVSDVRRVGGVRAQDENGRIVYCPIGFAHGFCVVSEVADVVYKQSNYYSGEHERGFKYDDPEVGIEWPLPTEELIPSERDATAPTLADSGRRASLRIPPLEVMTFAGAVLDRAPLERKRPEWLAEQRADPEARAILMSERGIWIDGSHLLLAPPTDDALFLGLAARKAAVRGLRERRP